jgi:hypothetical protein
VWKSVSLLPAPQGSLGAPEQAMLQTESATLSAPAARLFPQKHSTEYSVPAYEKPRDAQKLMQASFVMAAPSA